jgi:hypothetical protein
LEVFGYGQLDFWDYDGRCGDGRHDFDSLDFEPPHEFLEEDFSYDERRKIKLALYKEG